MRRQLAVSWIDRAAANGWAALARKRYRDHCDELEQSVVPNWSLPRRGFRGVYMLIGGIGPIIDGNAGGSPMEQCTFNGGHFSILAHHLSRNQQLIQRFVISMGPFIRISSFLASGERLIIIKSGP